MRLAIILLYALVISGTTMPPSAQAATAGEPSGRSATAEPSSSADSAADTQTTDEMLAAEAALEAAQAKAAPAGATASEPQFNEPVPAKTSADNNDDFVPTIQISEDLSVSFPADI